MALHWLPAMAAALKASHPSFTATPLENIVITNDVATNDLYFMSPKARSAAEKIGQFGKNHVFVAVVERSFAVHAGKRNYFMREELIKYFAMFLRGNTSLLSSIHSIHHLNMFAGVQLGGTDAGQALKKEIRALKSLPSTTALQKLQTIYDSIPDSEERIVITQQGGRAVK